MYYISWKCRACTPWLSRRVDEVDVSTLIFCTPVRSGGVAWVPFPICHVWGIEHRDLSLGLCLTVKTEKKKHPGLYAQPSQIFPTIHKDENEEIYSGGWMINEIVAYMLTLPVDKQGAWTRRKLVRLSVFRAVQFGEQFHLRLKIGGARQDAAQSQEPNAKKAKVLNKTL